MLQMFLHFSRKQRSLNYVTLNLSFVGCTGYYTFLINKLLRDFHIISKAETLLQLQNTEYFTASLNLGNGVYIQLMAIRKFLLSSPYIYIFIFRMGESLRRKKMEGMLKLTCHGSFLLSLIFHLMCWFLQFSSPFFCLFPQMAMALLT